MTERFAIYYAPARGSRLDAAASAWLARPELADLTISARRYGFHATLKAPMSLTSGRSLAELELALGRFGAMTDPVDLGGLTPQLIEGFLALMPTEQPQALTDFTANVVGAFEPFRAPMTAQDRARRLQAPLSPRQVELLDTYGYPYVFEEFRFHMTLTDRLAAGDAARLLAEAGDWFAQSIADTRRLDRLVLFREPSPGAAFERLAPDYLLRGSQ